MPRHSLIEGSPSSPGGSHDLTFLPVNQAHSPGYSGTRRAYPSCDNCRQKKKRCQPASEASCLRCQEESRVCSTTHRRKRRRLRPTEGSTTLDISGNADVATPDTIATPDAPAPTGELECSPPGDDRAFATEHRAVNPEVLAAHCADPRWGSNTKERILSTNILDARDALDLIAVTGSDRAVNHAGSDTTDLHPRRNKPSQLFLSAHEPSGASWDRFFLVKRGIIQAQEAVEYLDFYFAQLWQLLPIIPQWYSIPTRYGILADEEPVLTISLLTISSRYHPLSGFNGQARSERVHWRTWPWVQRLIQSSIWGSSAMRRFGSIAALLLFLEWHPRAINSPEDLISDCPDLESFEPHSHSSDEDGLCGAEVTELYRKPGLSSISEKLNMVAAAYRSNKMSWLVSFPFCSSPMCDFSQTLGCFYLPLLL